ncbi:MAG: 16S rRNA (guanine(527)-N(7))-methyltransferase RsmG [Gammaproteobacteria bacterium]|nr:16S rRNA (guanine(527)-N(7))-methyltransferase RsmG [Gammaproteobacteria bacterium]
MADLLSELRAGLAHLNMQADETQQQQLLEFVALLKKWNKVYNLTALRREDDMLRLHILDSLAVQPFVSGQRVVDIGSGAGLPGIPLAIMNPQRHFTLVDSNGKKTRFITQAFAQLKLKNVEVINSRCEDFHPTNLYDCVMARAFAAAPKAVALIEHLLAPQGEIVLMKSKQAGEELQQLPDFYDKKLQSFTVPNLNAERNVLILRRNQAQ